MDTVWKFPLCDVVNKVELPPGAEVLHVAEQHGQITLWARLDPSARCVTRTFHVVGTAPSVPDRATAFRGTAMAAGGVLVFHVFEGTAS